jgi:hypothetical protein
LFGGINLFTYSGNNPTNYTDPLGLFEAMAVALPLAPVLVMVDTPFLPFGDLAAGALIGLAYLWDTWPTNPPYLLNEDASNSCEDKSEGSFGGGLFLGSKDPGEPEKDIKRKVKRFRKLKLGKQKKEYKSQLKTFLEHLEKYEQEIGQTSGEVNRIERELRHYEWILRSRGQF